MTGYGFGGPMTAQGTVFADKDLPIATGGGGMLLMGVGSWILWVLIR